MGESSVKDGESGSNDQVQKPKLTEIATPFRSEFYEAYKRHARIFDKELNVYDKELNVTLLFAVLFAAVILTFLRLEEKNNFAFARDNPQVASTIAAIVFCSLAASLIVAVLTIFAKGILRHCVILDSTTAEPNHGRYRAPHTFHRSVPKMLTLFIGGLSLVLQISLLVIAYVLANHHDATLTVVGIEILCIALNVRPTLLGASGRAILKGITKPLLRALVSTKPSVKNTRQRTIPKRRPSSEDAGKVKITIDADLPLSPIFDKQLPDWSGCVSDSLCVAWMFDRTIDSEEVTVVLDFITEIVWHSGISEVPLPKVFEIFDKCFDYSNGSATLVPHLRDRAHKAGKALVHLGIQRKCTGEENCDPLEGFHGTRGPYGSHFYDDDLDSVLNIVDRLLGNPRPINWSEFKFSEHHLRWLSHVLLHRAWDHFRYESKLPDDIETFVTSAFSSTDTHPAVVADSVFIISLLVGVPLHVDDLAVDDKSSQIEGCYTRIFDKLESTFKVHVVKGYARALDGIRLIAPLQNDTVASKSYNLFRVILSSSFGEEEIWAAARHTIYGAFKWDGFLPWIEDPDDVLRCLTHHFAIQAKGEDGVAKEPIEQVLRGLAYASNETTLEALRKFDSSDTLFVKGIQRAFEEDRPFQTRKAALFFVPLIQGRWFDDSLEDVMSDEEKGEFCENWASMVDSIAHTVDVKQAACETFFGMVNSKKWRSHISKKLKLMEYFTDLPDDSETFVVSKENVSILPWLRSGTREAGDGKERSKFWKLWLAILWSDYTNLPKNVKAQVLEVTEAVISKTRYDVNFVSRVMLAEKEKYQTKLDDREAVSLDGEPEKLRARVEALTESIEKFDQVVRRD